MGHAETTGERRVLPVGDRALLVELPSAGAATGLAESLRRDPPTGVTEVVGGAVTVLVAFDPAATSAAALATVVRSRPADPPATSSLRTIELPTVYDGADLHEVAERTGLSPAEVVRRHAAATYTVAFVGFAPGFAYLVGGDPALRVPRRSTPRPRVPAGAVALADTYSGVYPRPSPGGWQLVGRTAVRLWDVDERPPDLLRPGTVVRFVPEARP